MEKRIWLTTDTHFGHAKMCQLGEEPRPIDFEKRLLDGFAKLIKEDDILVHLGDFVFNEHELWAKAFFASVPCKVWLAKGNHDKRSDFWYLDKGFSAVASTFVIKRFGYKIAFSHKPLEDTGYFDVNIHGHFHDNDHRFWEKYLITRLTPKHILLAVEWTDYEPVRLKKLLDKNLKI